MNWETWYQTFLTNCAESQVYPERFIVAFSGGLDSTVLLHVLNQLGDKPVLAVHVNHQLQSGSGFWAEHCQRFCESLQIDFACETISILKQKGYSVEAIARDKRYQALEHYVTDPNTMLLTAHHQMDQAETLLLQLCRGAGVKGLSGMPLVKPFSQGFLARPLLNVEYAQLVVYANENSLNWIEDPGNTDLSFDRNFMRCNILPLLQSRYPNVIENVTRSAEHCANADRLNRELAEMDFEKAASTMDPEKPLNQLLLNDFKQLPTIRQTNLLRYWLSELHWPMPSTVQLHQIIKTICFAKPDANPGLSLFPNQYQLRRYQHTLYAFEIPPWEGDPAWKVNWDLKHPVNLPRTSGLMIAKRIQRSSRHTLSLPENRAVTLQFYQSGERFWPFGRQGSHPVKKLCQEWQLTPWERKQLIFIYAQDTLIGIWHCLTDRYYSCDDRLWAGQILREHWELSYQSD